MESELYIDGVLVDLPKDSVIALSYAVNTLYEMKSVQGIVSNRINLPPTAKNMAACGFPDDINADFTRTVRRRKSCRYVQNTVEIIPDGYVEINSVDSKGISVFITAGNVDFFELITGSIRELNLSEYDHIFSENDIVNSRLNTTGYTYPIVQYGQIKSDHNFVNVRSLRPATFVHTVVNKIVAETGYTLDNRLETTSGYKDFYKSLIMPFALDAFTHSQRYLSKFQDQTVIVLHRQYYRYENRNPYSLRWDYKEKDAGNLFDLATGTYTAPRAISLKIKVTFPNIHTTRTWITDAASGGFMWLQKNRGRADQQDLATLDMTFAGGNFGEFSMDYPNTVLSAEVEMNAGDTITLFLEANRGESDAESADVVIGDARMTIEESSEKVLYGQEVQLESTLPDIPKKDFLKFIASMFCALVHTDNKRKIVSIVPFKAIKNNLPFAVDWSSKIANDMPTYAISIGEYGQRNKAKYKKDDLVSPEGFADAELVINDENLDVERDLFTLPFSASKEVSVLGGNSTIEIPKVKLDDTAPVPEYSVKSEPRLAIYRPLNTVITYTSDKNNDLNVSRRAVHGAPFLSFAAVPYNSTSLLLSSVLDAFYPDFKILLNDQRRIVLQAQLTELDIAELDFFKPIYLSKFGAYFYLAKITNYVGDHRLCKLELIKLY